MVFFYFEIFALPCIRIYKSVKYESETKTDRLPNCRITIWVFCKRTKTVIKKEALPANAQTFLKTHFGSKKPSYILEDKEILSTEYKVQFDNKIEIEFDKKGNWKEVDAKTGKIPKSIIPKKLRLI